MINSCTVRGRDTEYHFRLVWHACGRPTRESGRRPTTSSNRRVPRPCLSTSSAEFELPFTNFYDRHVPDISLDQLEEWFHGYFSQVSGDVLALPHALEFLEFCKSKKIRCFILSTVNSDYFATQAANAKMEGYFEETFLGIWDKRKKINEILDDHNLTREETLYVGDMQHDVDTAHHGGVFSAALLTGYNTLEQLGESDPSIITTNLAVLQKVLLKTI